MVLTPVLSYCYTKRPNRARSAGGRASMGEEGRTGDRRDWPRVERRSQTVKRMFRDSGGGRSEQIARHVGIVDSRPSLSGFAHHQQPVPETGQKPPRPERGGFCLSRSRDRVAATHLREVWMPKESKAC